MSVAVYRHGDHFDVISEHFRSEVSAGRTARFRVRRQAKRQRAWEANLAAAAARRATRDAHRLDSTAVRVDL